MKDMELTGACLDIWMKEAISPFDIALLEDYANYMSRLSLSFSIRFEKPEITLGMEEEQILKAIGYIPKQSIVICTFFSSLWYSIEAIMSKYGGYLKAGAPEEIIPKINGKAFKIFNGEDDSHYYLLDCTFVAHFFNEHQDLQSRLQFSVEEFIKERTNIRSMMQS